MFLGFVGTAWQVEHEASMMPGDRHQIAGYELTYQGTRMCPGGARCSAEEQATEGRRMLFADLEVHKNGRFLGRLSPAKFIYQSPPQTTTEVGLCAVWAATLHRPGRGGPADEARYLYLPRESVRLLDLAGPAHPDLQVLRLALAGTGHRAGLCLAVRPSRSRRRHGYPFTVLFAQSLAQPFADKWASAPSPEAPASARASTAP